MYKRILSAISLVVVVFTSFSQIAHAQDLDPDKQALVVQNCVSAQTVLQRIQHNDAATRVNRGQGYETIVSRLMTPLNSRTTSRGYNDTASFLTASTDRYQQALDNFKDHYQSYDNALSSALRTKCQQQPQKFYDYLEQARKQRQTLANDVSNLSNYTGEYKNNVQKLKGDIQ